MKLHRGRHCSLVAGAVLLATVALVPASSEAHQDMGEQAYVGRATIMVDNASRFLPEAVWPALDNDSEFLVKGEIRVDNEGRIVSGSLIGGAGMEWQFQGQDGDIVELSMQRLGQEHNFTVTGLTVAAYDNGLDIEGVMTDGIQASNFSLSLMGDAFDGQPSDHRTVFLPGIDIGASRVGLNSSGCGDDFAYYGTTAGMRAFSIASTSCNYGTQTAEWISGSSARHPLIGQNVFRLLDGKFEHIGQSFLKHSFCAVSENTCGACQGTSCSTLGIGCADTYWAGLNDGQDGGAKSDINPQGFGTTGGIANTHSHPFKAATSDPLVIRGRLQISDADILAGGQNFAEIHYVTHDEPLENRHNNASWREVNLSLTSITGVQGCQSSVHAQEPAIMAWSENDPSVTLKDTDVPGGGKFWVGYKVTDNGDGTWHYELAIQNLNSDRSAGSVSVPVPECVNVTNIGFHDVDYHSGELYDGTDWTGVHADGMVTWSTDTFASNPNANALRWGTLYNFRFDADAPGTVSATGALGLFKPGDPDSIPFGIKVPSADCPCVGDVDGSGEVDATDLGQLLGSWNSNDPVSDVNGDGNVDAADLALLLGSWGVCP